MFSYRFLPILFLLISLIANDAQANPKYASLVIDADTGVVLHQENAGNYRYPASLTKMMTFYLTFQALEKNKLRMNQRLRISSRAAAQPASKMGLKRGGRITVRDALISTIVKSANDSAVVLAEAIAGSEWQFALMMNRMARRLGMNHTHFRNATGLHDRKQRTTAYDMARLAVALRRDYQKYYYLFDRTKFFYKGKTYYSHNNVAKNYRGADGLKTGYVRASGFNLVTSARRNGRNIVGVVMGGRSTKRRDRHMVQLLDRAFYKLARAEPVRRKVYAGFVPVPKLKPKKYDEVASLADDSAEKAFREPDISKVQESGRVISSAPEDALFMSKEDVMGLELISKEPPSSVAKEKDEEYQTRWKRDKKGEKVPMPFLKPEVSIRKPFGRVAIG
ncbi:D-alanyl-D-alanine carboxypeptidase [Rickettsiales bacterium]|nr:D-alanyl-D-alanine carboxypeptidase [Rickettsiales bacterium]